jgi:hypothetical protein
MNADMPQLPIPPDLRRLLRGDDRAASILIWGAGAVCAACFAAALLAMALMT